MPLQHYKARCLLFCNVSSSIVISHSPRNRQEAEKKRESHGCPARSRVDVSEDVASTVFMFGLDEQCNAAGHQDENMEYNVCLCHLLHPVSGKRINQAAEDCEGCHDADDCSSGREVGEGPGRIKRRAH